MPDPERGAAPRLRYPGGGLEDRTTALPVDRTRPVSHPEGTQLSLDDLPPSARPSDPGTSWAMARDRTGRRRCFADRLLVTIAQRGERGATVAELQAVHGGESSTIARRCTDLRQRGMTRVEGERRSIRTDAWQQVHVATEAGIRRAASNGSP